MQATHRHAGDPHCSLAAVAPASGFPITRTLREDDEVDAALPVIRSLPGPVLYVAKVRAEPLCRPRMAPTSRTASALHCPERADRILMLAVEIDPYGP